LDSRFGITRAEFARAMQEAGRTWETAAGHKLFEPDSRGSLVINLAYDRRQEMTSA